MTERQSILCDIDHVLSNAFPRDHMIGSPWDDYHLASMSDPPIKEMIQMINCLGKEDFNMVALTSRPEKWRTITLNWFITHGAFPDELLMRPDGNYYTSPDLKVMLARNRFPDIKNEVAFVIEDRDDVCAAFRELGVTVLQAFCRRT